MPNPTKSQLALIRYFAGGPTPQQAGVRTNETTQAVCRREGWIARSEKFPFHEATAAGRQALQDAGIDIARGDGGREAARKFLRDTAAALEALYQDPAALREELARMTLAEQFHLGTRLVWLAEEVERAPDRQ